MVVYIWFHGFPGKVAKMEFPLPPMVLVGLSAYMVPVYFAGPTLIGHTVV